MTTEERDMSKGKISWGLIFWVLWIAYVLLGSWWLMVAALSAAAAHVHQSEIFRGFWKGLTDRDL